MTMSMAMTKYVFEPGHGHGHGNGHGHGHGRAHVRLVRSCTHSSHRHPGDQGRNWRHGVDFEDSLFRFQSQSCFIINYRLREEMFCMSDLPGIFFLKLFQIEILPLFIGVIS